MSISSTFSPLSPGHLHVIQEHIYDSVPSSFNQPHTPHTGHHFVSQGEKSYRDLTCFYLSHNPLKPRNKWRIVYLKVSSSELDSLSRLIPAAPSLSPFASLSPSLPPSLSPLYKRTERRRHLTRTNDQAVRSARTSTKGEKRSAGPARGVPSTPGGGE